MVNILTASLGVIGGADGPTVLFVTGSLGSLWGPALLLAAAAAVLIFLRKRRKK